MEVLRKETFPIYHCGPSLEDGPLPTLFYFALSGSDSLLLDPYNQPVIVLKGKPIRIVSLTIPGHGEGFDNNRAMEYWAQHMVSGENLITAFIDQCCEALDFLVSQGLTHPQQVGAAGLSRGGFIAGHFAARDKRVKTILGFSPLITLGELDAFKDKRSHPLVESLSLIHQVDHLSHATVRSYIGNRDTCVGTGACFEWIKALVEASFTQKHRSPPIELILYPSIGHKGHGTPPHIFQGGASWIADCLGS